MKNFKIVNLFIFIFVINLSITFLYKNNLFVKIFNGILQADDNHLLQRKQRNLAEAGRSEPREVSTHPFLNTKDAIEKFLIARMDTFKEMIYKLEELPVSQRVPTVLDIDVFKRIYTDKFNNIGFSTILEGDVYNSFHILRSHMFSLSAYDNLQQRMIPIFQIFQKEDFYIKAILDKFINATTEVEKAHILSPSYILRFILYHLNIGGIDSSVGTPKIMAEHIFNTCNVILNNIRECGMLT